MLRGRGATSWKAALGPAVAALLLSGCSSSPTGPDDKVTVCHVPPGNPGNAHTITISRSALPAHLAHGDTEGACPTDASTGACCGVGSGCEDLPEARCTGAGGTFQGAGTSCGDTPPPCAGGDKVTICHRPPGNPENARTITVSRSALPAHLAHGDTLGPCPGGR
jgi:hypothetical protein